MIEGLGWYRSSSQAIKNSCLTKKQLGIYHTRSEKKDLTKRARNYNNKRYWIESKPVC